MNQQKLIILMAWLVFQFLALIASGQTNSQWLSSAAIVARVGASICWNPTAISLTLLLWKFLGGKPASFSLWFARNLTRTKSACRYPIGLLYWRKPIFLAEDEVRLKFVGYAVSQWCLLWRALTKSHLEDWRGLRFRKSWPWSSRLISRWSTACCRLCPTCPGTRLLSRSVLNQYRGIYSQSIGKYNLYASM